MILIYVIFAVVIGAIAYFSLKADRVAPNRVAVYAASFAVVFLAGALAHQQLGRRPVAQPTREIATQPADRESAQNAMAVDASSLGALDAADMAGPNALHLRGWALGTNNQPVKKIIAIIDGVTRVDITRTYGRPRADVAASLKRPGVKNSGYDGTVPLVGVKPGDHQVRITVVASDHTTSSPANSTRTFVSQ